MPNEWYRAIPAQTADRTVTNVAQFDTAYAASTGGAHDRITMRGGTYNMARQITKSGLQIVAYPGEHVIIVGGLYFTTANDCWLIGIELTDPTNTSPTYLLGNTGKNNSFINLWSHHSGNDELSSIGDFGADTGGGSLIYGCVFHNTRHVIYIQNKSTNPTKYVAHNFLSRATIDGEGQGEYLVHLYSSDDEKVRNVHFLENIFSEGQCLVGASENAVSYDSRWERNNFERCGWRGTYNNPGEITFKNNKMFKRFPGTSRMIDLDDMHGANEAFNIPNYPQINTFTGNMIYNAGEGGNYDSINIEAKYLDSGGNLHFGDGPLRADDNFDNNIYQGVLRNTVKANGVGLFTTSLATWRSNTAGYGCQYDTNSTAPAGAPADYYIIYQNDYDVDRAMIFAWGAGATVPVVLPRQGAIYDVYDQWGAPLFSGGTNYNVPTNTIGFSGIIKYTPSGGGGGGGTATPQGAATESDVSNTQVAPINMPSTVVAGETLLAIVTVTGDDIGGGTMTGFTQIRTGGDGGNNTWYVFAKDATGSEGGTTVNFTSGDTANFMAAQVFRISGVSTVGTLAQRIEASDNFNGIGVTDPPALDPTNWGVENTLWITFCTEDINSLTASNIPAGYSNGLKTASGFRRQILSAWRNNNVASEDPGTFAAAGSGRISCVTIGVRSGTGVVDPGGTAFGGSRIPAHFRHRRS